MAVDYAGINDRNIAALPARRTRSASRDPTPRAGRAWPSNLGRRGAHRLGLLAP
jgi:hypothetical protein